jgi:hypothetical protein
VEGKEHCRKETFRHTCMARPIASAYTLKLLHPHAHSMHSLTAAIELSSEEEEQEPMQ